MKKTLTKISMILAVVMLVMACPLAALAAGEATAPFAEYGQDLYTINKNDYDTSTITIDGKIDYAEGWVCATPNGIDNIAYTSAVNNVYADGKNGVGAISSVPSSEVALADYVSDMNYYFAKNASNFYFALEDITAFVDSNENGILDAAIEGAYRQDYYIRIGFGADDETSTARALIINIDANSNYTPVFGAAVGINTEGTDAHNWAKNLTAAESLISAKATGVYRYVAEYESRGAFLSAKSSCANYNNLPTTRWVEYVELELSMEAIKSIYTQAYGVTLADEDFDNVTVSVATTLYNGGDLNSCWPTYSGTYAEFTSSRQVGLLPDAFRFVDEPATFKQVAEGQAAVTFVAGADLGINNDAVYSVDVAWQDLEFVYTEPGYDYIWNPDDLKYNTERDLENSDWSHDSGTITVTNRSNAEVQVTAAVEEDAKFTLENASFTLPSAAEGITEPNTPASAPTPKVIKVNRPDETVATEATITVTIAEIPAVAD